MFASFSARAGVRLRSAVTLASPWAWLAAWAFGMAFASGASAAAPAVVSMRDDLHRLVVLPANPQRIVTLLPSLTETVCALGACGRLVAVGRFDDYPPSIAHLPRVGDLDTVSIERIVALHPDLVLYSTSQHVGGRLADLGIPAFALETDRYEDIARTIDRVGALLGLAPRAAELDAQIDAAVRAVAARARATWRGHPPSVYFEVDAGPYAAGPGSYIGGLLERLGVRNIVAPTLGAFPLLNPEYVVRRDPDVILIPAGERARLADRPGWSGIRAVRSGRICALGADQRNMIMRPGPRVAQGLQAIAACLERLPP